MVAPYPGNSISFSGRRFARAAAIGAWFAAIMTAPGSGLAGQPISQRIHTAWRSRDGAPAAIKALAQSTDGLLWIGSRWGLFSFDGKIFTPVQSYAGSALPRGGVATILTLRDGAIWVGYTTGEVVRIFEGTIKLYRVFVAGENDWVVSLKQGEDGTIWCATNKRLLRLTDDGFRADEFPPQIGIRRFVSDPLGKDWLGTHEGLFERPRGKPAFTKVPGNFGIILAVDALPGGGLLVSDFDTTVSKGRTQRLDETGKVVDRLPGHDVANDVMIGQDGSIWLATQTAGLLTTKWPAASHSTDHGSDQVDEYRRADGLTSDAVSAVLQDQDGNVWVGTKTGVDRFRLATLSTFSGENDASTWFVCNGLQGDVWIANTAGKLNRVIADVTTLYRAIVQNIDALACGRGNDAWFAGAGGFWHAVDNTVIPVPTSPKSLNQALFQLLALKDGTLLANASAEIDDGDIWRFRDGVWSSLPALKQDGGVQKVFVDPSDRLWVIPRNHAGALDLVQDGKAAEIRAIPAEIGRVGPIISSSFGFLLGGQNGIALSTGGDFRTLSLENSAIATGVSGLVQARNGDVWLIGSRGVGLLPADQIGKAIKSADATISGNLIQENDFVGRSNACSCWNAAALGSDGKLWFAGLTGVVSVDPSALPLKPHLPVLRVKSMLADEQLPNSRHEFQPNPHTLRIAYAGVNLSNPDSVVYRYRLAGVDKAWQDVEKRTEATYTSLPPGRYTFEVMASNGDGQWTGPLIVPLTVLPSFYQTYWFIVLGAVSICALLWFVQSLYVRNVVALTRAKADARADERIRISQDIHDTLLQGVQGLLLHVHVAAQSVPEDHPSASMLERALSAASRIIVEGRESVSALRSAPLISAGLSDALEAVGLDLNIGNSVEFSVKCKLPAAGTERPTLTAQVADQVFYATREAITNAFHHAKASHVSVVLSYGSRTFAVRCKDDGVGLAADAAQDSRSKDHWGIRGMQERIIGIGGKLKLHSRPMQGTIITIFIPASRAYTKNVWWKNVPWKQ